MVGQLNQSSVNFKVFYSPSITNQPINPKSSTIKSQPLAATNQNSQQPDDLQISPEARKLQAETTANQDQKNPKTNEELTTEEKSMVERLQQADTRVRIHEQQHMAIAGGYAKGGPQYQYMAGPDGKRYATAGQVQLDLSPVPDNPAATISKAQTIRNAALAPADPSSADRAVAAAAANMELHARQELKQKQVDSKSSGAAPQKIEEPVKNEQGYLKNEAGLDESREKPDIMAKINSYRNYMPHAVLSPKLNLLA